MRSNLPTWKMLYSHSREYPEEVPHATYIEAWRDYWIARVELERALGGRLGPSTQKTSERPEPKKEVTP